MHQRICFYSTRRNVNSLLDQIYHLVPFASILMINLKWLIASILTSTNRFPSPYLWLLGGKSGETSGFNCGKKQQRRKD